MAGAALAVWITAWFLAVSAARVPNKDPSPAPCEAELPIFKDKEARKKATEVLVKVLPDYQLGRFKDMAVMRAVDNSTQTGSTNGCAEDSYGEIPVEYAASFFEQIKCTSKDSFVDLGSGLGRVVVDAAVLGGMHKAIGVELSVKRHEMACEGLQKAKKELDAIPGKAGMSHVELHQGDLLKFDLAGVTTVFASTICFRDALMEQMGAKLAQELPEGGRFAGTTDFPEMRPPPGRMERQEPVKAGYDFYLYLYHAKGGNATKGANTAKSANTTKGANTTLLQRRPSL